MPAPPRGPGQAGTAPPEADTWPTAQSDSGPLAPDPNDPHRDSAAYHWRHAVLMQQNRRMRSEEVHYLDHPMLGVLARVVPLSDEELEALAADEALDLEVN